MDAIERCRKLLERAEHPGTSEAEANACFEKAFAIMALAGIERAQIDAAADAAGQAREDDPVWLEVIELHGEYAKEQDAIIQSVIRPLGCAGCIKSSDNSFHMVGRQSDVERANLIATGMLLHAFNAMREQGIRGVRNRKQFLVGFAMRVGTRMREQYKKASAEQGEAVSTAIAKRDDEALEFLRKYFWETFGITLGRGSFGTGSAAGMRAGDSADIGQARFGGRAPRQLGRC